MKRTTNRFLIPLLACSVFAASPAVSQERESLESLRATTLKLIDALVESGVLSRQKADELIRSAQAVPPRADSAAAGAAAPSAVAGAAAGAAAAPGVVRVPYVPQVVRDQIRDEIKEEVLAQAKTERWGVPNATAEWTDRIRIDGDLRVRGQFDQYNKDNPSPEDFLAASLGGQTRAANLAAGTAEGLPLSNTQEDVDRLRVRARLGITAQVADTVTAGLRLSTGNVIDRTSTNQTLGNDFNKFYFLVDWAYIKLDPIEYVSLIAGRFANPFFHTELTWDQDVNLDGVAATIRLPMRQWRTIEPFATIGYFPIRADNPPQSSRSLVGIQVGAQWDINPTLRTRFGIAQYSYKNLQGQVEQDFDPIFGAGRTYGQYEYGTGLRQKGNSLFLTNSPLELQAGLTPNQALWGLTSKFKPLAITAAMELSEFAPVFVSLSGEYVKNQDFDRQEILARTGVDLTDGSDTGYIVRANFGAQSVRALNDWQLQLSYRRLGSDAVLDAFADSDFGAGGTNVKGYTAALLYGVARNTWLTLSYYSSKAIDSFTFQPAPLNTFSVNSWYLDLNARF